MKITQPKTAEQARDQAIDWSNSQESMSWGELAEWQDHFTETAAKYNLTDEFKENGII